MNIPLSQFRITSDGYLRVLEAVFDLSFPMSLAELHVQKDSNLLLLSLAPSMTNTADTTIKKAKPFGPAFYSSINWNLSGNNNSEQHQILCPCIDYTVFRSFRANMQDAGAQFFFYTIADGSANT